MISLYESNETDFKHDGKVLKDTLSCLVTEVANNIYELVLEHPVNDVALELTEGKIIKVPTPRNMQLFRIYKPVKSLTSYKIYARHITYDLLDNFIEDSRPSGMTGGYAINKLLNDAETPHSFSGFSNILDTNTSYIVRKNPIQALMGDDENSFINRWGGEVIRDNFDIRIMDPGGTDKGYEVRLGKNLLGIEEDLDIREVATKLYPTVVLGDNEVYSLPEKYVESPLINKYPHPIIREVRIDLNEEQREMDIKDLYPMMRQYCIDLFEKNDKDKPKVNYKIDFIELSKTEQYKDLAILEQVMLYDTVSVIVDLLDIDITAKVIKTVYNSLKDRYEYIELGSFNHGLSVKYKDKINEIIREAEEQIELVQIAANGKNKIFRGTATPASGMSLNDLWYKPVGDGETELYRYDGIVWKLEKVSAGLLGGKLDAENGDVDLINVNVSTLVGNISDFVKSYWNAINSRASIDGTRLRFTHNDGSYTDLSAAGLMRYDAGTGKKYHHLTKIIKFSIGGDGQSPAVRWIPIGPEFNDIDWSVALSISDSMQATSLEATLHRIVLTQGHDSNNNVLQPRYRNGQWEYPVTGYTTYYNHKTDSRRYSDLAGRMIVTA